MPRKSLADSSILKSVIEDFEALSVVRYEMALDVYNYQDKKTKAAIDRVVATLRQQASGTVKVKHGKTLYDLKVSDQTFGFNLFYLAVEVVSDLYFVGLQLANFEPPPNLCANCGDEVKPAKKKRGGR